MRHRFLLHSLNHTLLVVDVTEMKIETPIGQTKMVPALKFSNWEEAERHFRAHTADDHTLGEARAMLTKVGIAVITIV